MVTGNEGSDGSGDDQGSNNSQSSEDGNVVAETSGEGTTGSQTSSPGPILRISSGQATPETRSTRLPFNPDAFVRASMAYMFVIILLVTIVWAFYDAGLSATKWKQAKDLLELLLPAETALLGSAVGFYFGARKEGT